MLTISTISRASIAAAMLCLLTFGFISCTPPCPAAPPPENLANQPDACKRLKCDCGCADGGQCDCVIAEAQAEAELWITTPGLTQAAFPDKLPDATLRAVERFCHEHDLYRSTGAWDWSTQTSHATWLAWANEHYHRNYKDAQRFPSIEDANRLPKREDALQAIERGQAYLQWLNGVEMEWEHRWAMQKDTQDTISAWECIRDARDESYCDLARRRQMQRLRHFIGEDEFWAGNWPPTFIPASELPKW